MCVCLYACACRTSKKENVHNWYCLNVYSWSWDHSWCLKIPSSINHFLFPLPSFSQGFSWSVLYLSRWPTQTLICDGSESCSFLVGCSFSLIFTIGHGSTKKCPENSRHDLFALLDRSVPSQSRKWTHLIPQTVPSYHFLNNFSLLAFSVSLLLSYTQVSSKFYINLITQYILFFFFGLASFTQCNHLANHPCCWLHQ